MTVRVRCKARLACWGIMTALAASLAGGSRADPDGNGRDGGSPQGSALPDLTEVADEPRWRLFAVEYARSEDVSERRLVRGPAGGKVDMSWYYFVAVGHGRVVLVDCGTDALARQGRKALRARWSIEHAMKVTEALQRVGLGPKDVTDVVLTHFHWDHVGGLPAFPQAQVHVHRGEWARIPVRLRSPVRRDDRRHLLSETPEELWSGFRVREAGRHTRHQLMVELECGDGPVVIAGDAAYLYRNIEQERPVTVTTSHARNVADVQRAVERVGAEDVLPGHDPAIFERYPSPVDKVAAICP